MMVRNSSLVITKADNGWRLDLESYGPISICGDETDAPRKFSFVYPDTEDGVGGMIDDILGELNRDD
jgi:hypothetical protein